MVINALLIFLLQFKYLIAIFLTLLAVEMREDGLKSRIELQELSGRKKR